MPQEMPELNKGQIVRERVINLFIYLKELALLRGKPTRDINKYESILWFSDIPREPECLSPIWNDGGQSLEIWLEIKKPRRFSPPAVPIKLRPWIDETTLMDCTEIPELYKKIPVSEIYQNETDDENEFEESPKYIESASQPEIEELFEQYFDEKWAPWAQEDARLKRIQDGVYAKLHGIHQLLKSSEEEYELVLGFGLLTWKSPSNQDIRRTLITCQASMELDPRSGALYVKQGIEGAKSQLEEEMLEISERCQLDVRKELQGKLDELGDDIWDIPEIEGLLKTWVYSVSAKGKYNKELSPPSDLLSDPVVTYAPVLILRKRNVRSLIKTYGGVKGKR